MTKSAVWSKVHESRRRNLFNYFKKVHPEARVTDQNFIDKYKTSLASLIEKNNKWSDGTKEGFFFMIARRLEIDNKRESRYRRLYSQYGYDIMKKKEKTEAKNEQSPKELENYRDKAYFKSKIETIKDDSIKNHYEKLLLQLLTLQPPVRTSFYSTAKFIRSKKDDDGLNNFIWITKRGKVKGYYIINNDKVTKTRYYSMHSELKTIEINEELAKILDASLNQYPRAFLFEDLKTNRPFTDARLLKLLKTGSGVKGLDFNMMRSSYINDYYEQNRTFDEKNKLADQMRHSVLTAQKNYVKIRPDNKIDNKDEIIKELKQKITELELKISNMTDEKPDETTMKKRKRDLLYLANHKKTILKEATKKKYNIKYESGIYY